MSEHTQRDVTDSLAMLLEEERSAREEYQQTTEGTQRLWERAAELRVGVLWELLNQVRDGHMTVAAAAGTLYGSGSPTNDEAFATEIGSMVRQWLSNKGRREREETRS